MLFCLISGEYSDSWACLSSGSNDSVIQRCSGARVAPTFLRTGPETSEPVDTTSTLASAMPQYVKAATTKQ